MGDARSDCGGRAIWAGRMGLALICNTGDDLPAATARLERNAPSCGNTGQLGTFNYGEYLFRWIAISSGMDKTRFHGKLLWNLGYSTCAQVEVDSRLLRSSPLLVSGCTTGCDQHMHF